VAGQPRPAEETSAWAATLNGSAEQIEARHASAAPPAFPEKIEGYNHSREWRDTVRAFERTDWSTQDPAGPSNLTDVVVDVQ
jgi:hypothetical protein